MTAVYEYGPFGEPLRATGPLAKANPIRFSSELLDPTTEFYYYGYRYYNPDTGRWLSRDPIGELGGVNLYAFTKNAPLNLIDLFGLLVVGAFDKPLEGAQAFSRWLSAATPPDCVVIKVRIPQGCKVVSATPAGVETCSSWFRGCRYAHPPANRWHPSGMAWLRRACLTTSTAQFRWTTPRRRCVFRDRCRSTNSECLGNVHICRTPSTDVEKRPQTHGWVEK